MEIEQKNNITRKLKNLKCTLTPHEYRGVEEVLQLLKYEKLLPKVLRLAEERKNAWDNYYKEVGESHARNAAWGVKIAIGNIKDSMKGF